MRTNAVFGALLALLTLTMPAGASELFEARPVAHEEVTRTLDDLLAQLHSLGARWREHFLPADQRGERPLITLMLRHRDELGLSPEQVQKLERLRADFQREAVRREADLRIAEMDLATLLDADTADLSQVEAKVREIERLRADLRLARIRTIEQGKAQLTAEQRVRLRALLAEPPQPRLGRPAPPAGGERL